jgi:phosphatidylinositol alpha-1,6-mannosyltransferase
MKKVTESNPNVNLTIAGDGSQKKNLEKQAKKLQLTRYVEFAGKVPFASLSQLYADCDIVVFPSIYAEPFGRVALEAMYFGKPVVASRVGGIPEVVDDKKTGLIVSPDNPKELSDAIITIVRDLQLRQLMGNTGKLAIKEKFDSRKIISQNLCAYEFAQKAMN